MSSEQSPFSAIFALTFAVLMLTSTAFSGVALAAGQASVAGNVSTQEGNADNITVELSNTTDTFSRTKSEGENFNFTGLDSGEYELVITEPIHNEYNETIVLTEDENYTVGSITLNSSGDSEIYGQITTEGSENFTELAVINASGDVVFSDTNLEVGNYSVVVSGDDSPYTVAARADDHKTVTQSVSISSVQRVNQDILLPREYDGYADGSATLENATGQNITLEMSNASTNNLVNSTEIQSGGTYNFTQDPGIYNIQATAPNHIPEVVQIEITENNTTTTNFALDARPETIAGDVKVERNDYTGDISVTIEDSGGTVVNQTTATGNNSTSFDLNVDGTGDYTVYADATGYTNESQTVTISNTSEVGIASFGLNATDRGDFTIGASTSDSNAAGITIDIQQTANETTISDGSSETFDLPTGPYDVSISANGYQDRTISISNSNDNSQSRSVTLQKDDGTANVTVDAPNADPTQNFTVTVNETGDSQVVENGETASFTLAPDSYNVTADATNFTSDSTEITVTSNDVSLATLSPFEPKTMNLTLNLENTSAASNGTISIAETGNSYTVNDNDSVSVTGLQQGDYTVTADATDHISQTTTVTVDDTGGEETFNLTYDDGNTGIVGITTTSEDGNATQFEVNIVETGQTFSTTENESVQVELSTGNYTITAESNGYNASTETVNVTKDSTTGVTFELPVDESAQVNASGQRIADSKSLWVGQDMFREGLGNYTNVQWENEVTGITYNRSIDADDVYRDSVVNVTDQLGSNADYTLYGVNSSGNRTQIATVFLGIQTINTTITPNETVSDAQFEFNSNRQAYEVIVTQDASDTNQLNDSVIQGLFDQNGNASLQNISGTQEVVVGINGTSETIEVNMSELERATYNFNFEVVDTPTTDSANVTLIVSSEETQPDETLTDGDRFWLGQNLLVDDANISAQETIGVYRQANNTFVQELTADELGEVIIDTESLGTGDYYIEDASGQQLYTFNIARQSLDASWTDNEILNGGSQTESGLTIESNRARYDLLINATVVNSSNTTNVSASDLADAFDLNTTTVNDTEYAVARDISNPDTLVADFDNLSSGNYTFSVRPADAVGQDTAEITVDSPVAGQALFKEQFYTHNRGDIAKIDVEFTGDTQTTLVKIGRPTETGYQLRANVTRQSNTSEVTLLFNSSKAGQGMPSDTLYAKNNTADVDVLSETELDGDRRLEDARYLMEMQVDNQTTDLSTLNLFEAHFYNGETYGVPPTVSSVGSEEVVSNESVVMEEIDGKSYVAFGFKVQGLETQLNDTNRTPAQFNPNDSFSQNTGLSLTVEKDNAGANLEPTSVNAGEALAYHYIQMDNTSEENQTAMVWFVFDGSDFSSAGDGGYEANFTVNESNYFIEETQSLTTNFTFVDSKTEFDRHWSNDLLVLPEDNQTFTGTTTLPPGTTLRHEIRSDNVRYPFYEATDINVTENQTFNATYDMSDVPLGLTFNTSIPSQMDNKTVEVVPEIDPAPPDQMANVTVWTQANSQPYEAEITFSNNTLQDTTVSTSGTPPSGQVYVEKGTYTVTGDAQINDTNITIDQQVTIDGDTDLIVNMTPNGGVYEFADPTEKPDRYTVTVELVDESNSPVDGVVTIGGQQKVATDGTVEYTLIEGERTINARAHNFEDASRTITLDQDQRVTIEMTQRDDIPQPPEDTSNNTTPTTTETPGQPGFGVVVALIALLGAALLAHRRD